VTLVLGLTGAIYSLLEPGFGLNRATFLLFAGAVLGVGVLTYVTAGLEALMLHRTTGARAAVRPFPLTIAIALVSVAVSRALDLQPGVMYGMVASCVALGPVAAGDREKGLVALAPVTAGLVAALAGWLALAPLRSASEPGWTVAVLETVAVVVFIGGLESLVFSMIPLAATDGGKIYRWNRLAWAVLVGVAAFLAWHVLAGRDRAFFSGLRETSSLAVAALFVGYTALTAAAWAYFRFRRETGVSVPAALAATGLAESDPPAAG
jgi:hypothetical protein